MKFYIQNNIAENDLSDLVAIFEKHQISYELFYHKPFDTQYPVIDTTQPAFLYGASAMTDQAWLDLGEKSGVFAHTKDTKLSHFMENSDYLMWNKPMFMGKIKDFTSTESEFFIRPLNDSKWLSGTVMTRENYEIWYKQLVNIDFDLNQEIFVSKVNIPQKEYRIFVVSVVISTASQYKQDDSLYLSSDVPESVKLIVEQFMLKNRHILPKSFVVDVGVSDDKIGVIEVNGINNSGFYAIDKEKLILDLIASTKK